MIMERSEIITKLKKYFTLSNLVCPDTYKAFGDRGWQFLRTDYLHTLLIVRRDILQSPMLCNNYLTGGKNYTQRGLRCNLCEIVREKSGEGKIYLSAHLTGCAGDFNVVGMTSVQARHLIMDHIDKLPYPIRLEEGVTWLHLDTYDSGNNQPYTLFKA
jgi:hypothetical protein